MSGISLDSAKEQKKKAQRGDLRDNDAGIPDEIAFDYEQHDAPIVKGHPECLVTFDRIVSLSPFNTGDDFLSAQNNLELGGDRQYGNDVVITVENPEVVEGEVWTETGNDFRDFRVLGDPTTDFSPYDRNTTVDESGESVTVDIDGVSLGMGGFEGEPSDDGFGDVDFVQFFVSSRRASSILGQLDTAGMWSHDTEDHFTEGIIEAPPMLGEGNYDPKAHGAPRAIGYPELRADMVDQQGAIAWTFGDDEPTTQSPVSADVFKVEDGLVGLAPLTPEDEDYALPEYPRGGNLYYDDEEAPETTDSPNTADAGDGPFGADADPETDATVSDATEMMEDTDTDEDIVELAYEDLPDAAQEFVNEAVGAAVSKGFDSITNFDDWDERFAVGTSDIDYDLDQERVTEIIDHKIDA